MSKDPLNPVITAGVCGRDCPSIRIHQLFFFNAACGRVCPSPSLTTCAITNVASAQNKERCNVSLHNTIVDIQAYSYGILC